jgi:hypothetical protein
MTKEVANEHKSHRVIKKDGPVSAVAGASAESGPCSNAKKQLAARWET